MSGAFLCNMDNNEIEKKNGDRKWDICLMNPPYGGTTGSNNILDLGFIKKVNEISDKAIIISTNRMTSHRRSVKDIFEQKHLYDIEVLDAAKTFNIAPYGFKYVLIQCFDNTSTYDLCHISFNGEQNQDIDISSYENRDEYLRNLDYPKDILNLIEHTKKIYKELLDKYKSMCHDSKEYIYEENKGGLNGVKKEGQIKLKRVKHYLRIGKYKYCLYKGSGNHDYDEVKEWKGENPDELFNGQICWLTNKENVKNNIKYWLESPLCDLWRRYYFNGSKFAACWTYTSIPAVDFDKPEDEFKEYVDSLYDFSESEIKVLKDNKIHNANKL